MNAGGSRSVWWSNEQSGTKSGPPEVYGIECNFPRTVAFTADAAAQEWSHQRRYLEQQRHGPTKGQALPEMNSPSTQVCPLALLCELRILFR